MRTLANTKIKTKIIPMLLNGKLLLGVPFDISKDKLELLISPLLKGSQNESRLKECIFKNFDDVNNETSKYFLVNKMVETVADISQDLVDKASSLEDENLKIMSSILARSISSFGSAQLLFNFSYYIEFIAILRMVFEQCGYVVLWSNKRAKPKKGPQSVNISQFNQIIPSATRSLHGELCETAHLDIYKDRKLTTVENEYKQGDALVIASRDKTIENYHIYEDVFVVLVDTLDYFITKFFSDDSNLLTCLEVVKLNKTCILSLSQKGYVDQKEIMEKFPDALKKAVYGFDEKTQENLVKQYGSLDAFATYLEKYIK